MVCPRWIDTRTQPIAIRDVVGALAALADPTTPAPSEVQLGGADVLSYREMMRRYAAAAGRRAPLVVRVPVLTPRLSSYWLGARDAGRHRRRAPAGPGPERRDARAHAAAAPGSTTSRWASTTPCERPWPKTPGRLLPCPPSSSPPWPRCWPPPSWACARCSSRRSPSGCASCATSTTRPRSTARPARCARCSRPRSCCPPSAIDAMWSPRVPRAPGAHLLALPHARDARPHPRLLHRGRALRLPALPAAEAPDLPGARVRDGRPPRRRALAHRARAARRPPRARRRRLPGDRRRAPPRRRSPAWSTSPSRSRWPTSTPPSPRA